jgi:hypothetical protein
MLELHVVVAVDLSISGSLGGNGLNKVDFQTY